MPVIERAKPSHRKQTGAYYTPAPLINLLLNHALPALANQTNPQPPHCPPPTAHCPTIRILDPACGPADFLAAIHSRMPGTQLFGVDINPQTAQSAIQNVPTATIACADALLNPPAFLAPQSFDLIIGNPPFVNAIENAMTAQYKFRLRAAFPQIHGPADLAHYFLAQAVSLLKPGGQIAFVLPRNILNSAALHSLRSSLPAHLAPNLIYAPDRCNFFPGAAVFVCLLILGPDNRCQISADEDPENAHFRPAQIHSNNWWEPFHQLTAPAEFSTDALATGPLLKSHFSVQASMTAGDAYQILPHITDNRDGPGQKLITTGLIEPAQSLWGRQRCRYLKHYFHHPRLSITPISPSLDKRREQSRRPKIIVAGLTRKIEAFLDETGECIGAVSTYTIYHPHDDLAALRSLLQTLLSPQTTTRFSRELGASGLRGRHITVKKSFLQNLPI